MLHKQDSEEFAKEYIRNFQESVAERMLAIKVKPKPKPYPVELTAE